MSPRASSADPASALHLTHELGLSGPPISADLCIDLVRDGSTNRAFPYPRHGRPGGVGSDQQMVEQLVVRLDDLASSAEVDEVREILASSELAAEVRADWQKPPPEPQTGNGAFWMILFSVGAPLGAVITGLAQRAGQDAYDSVKSFVKRLRRARRASRFRHGVMQFEDSEGTTLVIARVDDEDLDDALDKLREVDWAQHAGETILWDGQEWFSYERRFGGKN